MVGLKAGGTKHWLCYCGRKHETVRDYAEHMAVHPVKCRCKAWFSDIDELISHTCRIVTHQEDGN